MEKWTRRRFFLSTRASGLAAGTRGLFGAAVPATAKLLPQADRQASELPIRPLIVSAANGLQHLDDGMAILISGGDTRRSVLAVLVKVEDDPRDDSVGLV